MKIQEGKQTTVSEVRRGIAIGERQIGGKRVRKRPPAVRTAYRNPVRERRNWEESAYRNPVQERKNREEPAYRNPVREAKNWEEPVYRNPVQQPENPAPRSTRKMSAGTGRALHIFPTESRSVRPADPADFLNPGERRAWNRLSERKREVFIRKAGRRPSIFSGRTGISVGTENPWKEEGTGWQQANDSFFHNRKETEWERENVRNFGRIPKKGETSTGTFGTAEENGTAGSSESTENTTGKQTAKATKQGIKTAGGAVVRTAMTATEQAKKAADTFREYLTASKVREQAEEERAERAGREVSAKAGVIAGIAATPVAAVLTTTISAVFSVLITLMLPIIAIIAVLSLVIGVLVLFLGGTTLPETQGGFFGAKYYWIEYETGKTDDSAFATVLGDGGAAFGIQFDYRYTLQGFLGYCYQSDPIAYHEFLPFLQMDKTALKGNQALANAWRRTFDAQKEDFIAKQKDFTNDRYYLPAENRLEGAGIHIRERSEVCKGAVLSFVFQGCRMGIDHAVENAGITNETSDEEFLKKLYAYRRQEYSRFESRYEREVQTALGILNGSSAGAGFLTNPCPGARISSEFGPRPAPTAGASTNHNGRDYAAPSGTAILAAADGVVKKTAYNGVRGNYLIIDHGGGVETWYQHCSSISVAQGTQVSKGQTVAAVGSTGISTGAHLHFEVHVNGTPEDPRKYL